MADELKERLIALTTRVDNLTEAVTLLSSIVEKQQQMIQVLAGSVNQ